MTDDSPALPTGAGATLAPLDRPAPPTALVALGGVGLFLATLALFARTLGHDFVAYDDNAYVTANPRVQAGLTADSLRWTLTARVAANWHPLTILTHQLDCQLYGLWAPGHHLTNVLLHALVAVLTYAVWGSLTGRWLLSLTLAALWAWHPLRVESVAWVAERKDVLSGVFWWLVIAAYLGWVRRPGAARGAAVAVLLALGLLAKPMLVTLPCVLVLLDYWPLERLPAEFWRTREGWRALAARVGEKWALWLIIVAASVITLWTQQETGAVRTLGDVPWGLRLMNVVVSYPEYVGKLVWPWPLAVIYPLNAREFSWLGLAASGGALGAVTWAAFVYGGRFRYLWVGWLWFLGTLVPVIGFVHIGGHALADRYSYLPSLGLGLVVVWGLAEAVARGLLPRTAAAAGVTTALAALGAVTWVQLGYWKNTETLFTHTLAVTTSNWVAHEALANGYVDDYRRQQQAGPEPPRPELLDRAIAEYRQSLKIRAETSRTRYNLAFALRLRGQLDEAAQIFGQLAAEPEAGSLVHYNLADTLAAQGQLAEAAEHFARAFALEPTAIEARVRWAEIQARLGATGEARRGFDEVLTLAPGSAQAASGWARLAIFDPHATPAERSKAERVARQAVERSGPGDPKVLETLALAQAARGRWDEARQTLELALGRARELAPRFDEVARLIPSLEERQRAFARESLGPESY